ncbi:hypothetical protein CN245_27490 [Sinorhizobium meliloti]|nr:hypothetical protein CN245_27490 [Sinorhizobium meliloti]
MEHCSIRQLGLLLLAALLAAGMGLSVAQASGMAAKMATMSDMAMSDHGDCQGCPDNPHSAMKAMACGNVCAAAVVAPLPAAVLVPTGQKAASVAPPERQLTSNAWPPDPDPPRTSNIG